VHPENSTNQTPVDSAVSTNHIDVVAVLIKAGAQVFPYSKMSLIAANNVSMFKLVAIPDEHCRADFALCAVEHERTEILEFLLEMPEQSFTVEMAQELLQNSKNAEIKTILQKWINKKLGIPVVKKEKEEVNE
jgi:hypothetical protein